MDVHHLDGLAPHLAHVHVDDLQFVDLVERLDEPAVDIHLQAVVRVELALPRHAFGRLEVVQLAQSRHDQVRLPGDRDARHVASEPLFDDGVVEGAAGGDLVEHLAAEGIVQLLRLDVMVVPLIEDDLAHAVEELGDGDLRHLAADVADDAGEDRLDEAALGRVRPGVFDAVRKADVALTVRTAEPLEQSPSFPG